MESKLQLRLRIVEPGADAKWLSELVGHLRRALLQLDVDAAISLVEEPLSDQGETAGRRCLAAHDDSDARPVGCAVIRSRPLSAAAVRAREAGDGTWLAYAVYAHSHARLVLSELTHAQGTDMGGA
jgi:hypothetical protein